MNTTLKGYAREIYTDKLADYVEYQHRFSIFDCCTFSRKLSLKYGTVIYTDGRRIRCIKRYLSSFVYPNIQYIFGLWRYKQEPTYLGEYAKRVNSIKWMVK